jgi:hypothetical protein
VALRPFLSQRTYNPKATLRQIEEATAARNSALLADDDKLAARVAVQIDGLRQAARGRADKIVLLESALAREQAAAAAQRHEVHLREFEQTLAQADAAGDELQNAVAQLEQSFRKTIRLRELALSMWPFGKSSHGDAVARTPEGCALAAGAISTLLQHELHRIGTQERLGGNPGERVKVPLPVGVKTQYGNLGRRMFRDSVFYLALNIMKSLTWITESGN